MAEKWSLSNKIAEDRTYKSLQGRFLAQLLSIEERQVKKYEQPEETEPKLLYVFGVVDKKLSGLGTDEAATATMWLRPSMFRATGKGRNSKMIEVLDSMSESGKVPDSAMASPAAFQEYAEGMIGKFFMLTIEPRNGFNNIKACVWVSQGEIDRLVDPDLVARGEPKYPSTHKKEQMDFSGYKDAEKPAKSDKKEPSTAYYYELSELVSDNTKLERALALIGKADGKQTPDGQWMTLVEIPQLKRLQVNILPKALAEDEIPF